MGPKKYAGPASAATDVEALARQHDTSDSTPHSAAQRSLARQEILGILRDAFLVTRYDAQRTRDRHLVLRGIGLALRAGIYDPRFALDRAEAIGAIYFVSEDAP